MKTTANLLTALCCALTTVTAVALDSHVEAVLRTVEAGKGKVEKTTDGQSLKLVDLAVPGAGPHDPRKGDPYDASFFEHLGHITTLESLNVISTQANDEWIKPLGKLTSLKSLRFTNNGKLTDAGRRPSVDSRTSKPSPLSARRSPAKPTPNAPAGPSSPASAIAAARSTTKA